MKRQCYIKAFLLENSTLERRIAAGRPLPKYAFVYFKDAKLTRVAGESFYSQALSLHKDQYKEIIVFPRLQVLRNKSLLFEMFFTILGK